MASVFISYRRDDCAGHAGRLYDRLADRIGDDAVFMDFDAIEPGVDFGLRIEEAIGACRLVIVLIGDDWLDICDARGRRRLDDPTDLVRHEIAGALRRSDVRVIPVLVEGASMPAAEQLPVDLKALARRNALELSDAGWRYDVERLIEVVERVVPPAAPPSSPTSPPSATTGLSSGTHAGASHAPPSGGHEHDSRTGATAAAGGDGAARARRPLVLAAGAAVLAAGALAATVLAGADDSDRSPTDTDTVGTAQADPTQPRPTSADAARPLPIAARPNAITYANGSLWVMSNQSRDLLVLDPETERQKHRVRIGEGGSAVAAGFNSIWVLKANTGSLIRLSRTGGRQRTIPIAARGEPVVVATGAGAVWVGVRKRGARDGTGESLVRIDPRDHSQQQTAIAGGIQDVAAGGGAAWVTSDRRDVVVRIDARNIAKSKAIHVGDDPFGVAVGQGATWVANTGEETITPISPRGHARKPIPVEFSPTRVTTGGGAVWATARQARRLIRIDPKRRQVREYVKTGSQPFALDVTGGRNVWVTLLNDSAVQQVHFYR